MSTTSPVTSFEAAVSGPCCSCPTASGETAKAAMNVAATASLPGVIFLFVKLNMKEDVAVPRFGQLITKDADNLFARFADSIAYFTGFSRSAPRIDRKNSLRHAALVQLQDDIAR